MKEPVNMDTNDKITIGAWTLRLASGLLSDGKSAEVYLEPRLATLFYLLGKHPNQLVTRKQLIEHIWNETFVNEESLTKAVSDLRKLLATHFEDPPQIRTIPKRGYKMVIATTERKKTIWKTVGKIGFWGIVGFVLMILVIRGLNY